MNTVDAVQLSDSEAGTDEESRGPRGRKRKFAAQSQYVDEREDSDSDDQEDESDEDEHAGRRVRLRLRNNQANQRNLRGSRHPVYTNELQDDDGDSSDDLPFLDSDLPGSKRRLKLRNRGTGRNAKRSEEDISTLR